MENKARVEKHNRLARMGKHSYELKMNHFGDLLNHEFRAIMNGYRMRSKNQTRSFQAATFIRNAHTEALPEYVDWRKLGAVTPVKDQVKILRIIKRCKAFNFRDNVAHAGHFQQLEPWKQCTSERQAN